MKNLLISCLVALSFAATASGKVTSNDKVSVGLPKVLGSSIVTEEELLSKINAANNWGQNDRRNAYWLVLSDRDMNPVYKSPGGEKLPGNGLYIGQKMRIAEIRDNWAHVYMEERSDAIYPEISPKAINIGWVPMDNLLLWVNCPTNRLGIYNKAYIAYNVQQANDDKQGFYFRNPQMDETKEILKSSAEFFFVFKRDKKRGLDLLANAANVDDKNIEHLKGWVSPSSYAPWNQRACVEPNWVEREVNYFKDNTEACVYTGKDLKTPISQFPYGKQNSVSRSPNSKFRMEPNAPRFPLLDDDEINAHSSIYKMLTFANPNGGSVVNGQEASEVLNDVTNQSNNFAKNQSTLNLIIAIDGTKSMEPYFPAVKDAIKEAIKAYTGGDYNLKVGIVIYRDYGDGEYVTEHVPCIDPSTAANRMRLNTFLDTGGKYGVKSGSADRTFEEALYKGIELATNAQAMGFPANQSNLLMVIGDCGNDLKDNHVTEETLLKQITASKIQVISFQVGNREDRAWRLFNMQMRTLMSKSINRLYEQLGNTADLSDNWKFRPENDGVDLKDEQNPLYVASMRYVEPGMTMRADELKHLMVDKLDRFKDNIRARIRALSSQNRLNREYIKSIGGQAFLDKLEKSRGYAFAEGYARRKDPTGEHDYWKPVLFISDNELKKLIDRLRPVYEASRQQSDDRMPYVNALKALIRSMVPDISEDRMNRMSTTEVMNLAAGLNATARAVRGHSLLDIQDKNVVSPNEYQTLISDFSNAYLNLRDTSAKGYKFQMVQGNNVYYWLPIDELP